MNALHTRAVLAAHTYIDSYSSARCHVRDALELDVCDASCRTAVYVMLAPQTSRPPLDLLLSTRKVSDLKTTGHLDSP